MKFRFRLDGLLRVRHFELRRRIARLAEQRREHTRLCEREQAEIAAGAEAERRALEMVRGGADAARLHDLGDAAEGWFQRAGASAERASAAQQRALRARAAMLETRSRVEALERLRERRLARWQSDEQRRAQRELDEVGLRGFGRRGGRR